MKVRSSVVSAVSCASAAGNAHARPSRASASVVRPPLAAETTGVGCTKLGMA